LDLEHRLFKGEFRGFGHGQADGRVAQDNVAAGVVVGGPQPGQFIRVDLFVMFGFP
jgi:hypothetical protein